VNCKRKNSEWITNAQQSFFLQRMAIEEKRLIKQGAEAV
jgi:hypothetical protein